MCKKKETGICAKKERENLKEKNRKMHKGPNERQIWACEE